MLQTEGTHTEAMGEGLLSCREPDGAVEASQSRVGWRQRKGPTRGRSSGLEPRQSPTAHLTRARSL